MTPEPRSSDGSTRDEPPPRRPAQLLTDRVFGVYILAKLLSTSGMWIHNVVAAILAYEMTGSAFVVGLVSVAQFGPQMLFAPLSGALADRGDRRVQLLVGKGFIAFATGGLALWIALAGVDGLPGPWPIILAAGIVGIGFVLAGPAQNALVPALVRREELSAAITLNSMPPTLARAMGPAVGALVAISLGPAAAFALASFVNVLYIVLLLPMRIRTRAEGGKGRDRRIRAGVQYLKTDRGIALLLVGTAMVGLGADPSITLMPPLSDAFGAGASLVGVFMSSFGVGAGAMFLLIPRLQRSIPLERLSSVGLGALAGGIAVTGVSPWPTLTIVALVIGGGGLSTALTSFTTLVQQRLPDQLRGRIMALWGMAFMGSRPIAAAVNGAIADAAGPRVALVIAAALVAFGAWWCRPGALASRPAPDSEQAGSARPDTAAPGVAAS